MNDKKLKTDALIWKVTRTQKALRGEDMEALIRLTKGTEKPSDFHRLSTWLARHG